MFLFRNGGLVGIIHHCSLGQIATLEEVFACLTEEGWVIPDWLQMLKDTADDAPSDCT